MKNEDNEGYFNNAEIKLGTNSNEYFSEFLDSHGKRCGFWDFSYKLQTTNGVVKIYLFTIKRKNVNEEKITASLSCTKSTQQSSLISFSKVADKKDNVTLKTFKEENVKATFEPPVSDLLQPLR